MIYLIQWEREFDYSNGSYFEWQTDIDAGYYTDKDAAQAAVDDLNEKHRQSLLTRDRKRYDEHASGRALAQAQWDALDAAGIAPIHRPNDPHPYEERDYSGVVQYQMVEVEPA